LHNLLKGRATNSPRRSFRARRCWRATVGSWQAGTCLIKRPVTTVRIRDLKVTVMPVAVLQPYAGNPRTHSKKQVRQIAASIRAFGWTNPILIDGKRMVIAGHGRLKAATMLGIAEAPTICINDMTEAQKRAYILADNKLADNAGWDRELLTLELQGLLELDLDFDVTVTGFEMGEIDLLLDDSKHEDEDVDELPEIDPASPPITAPGDLWQVGPHRLLCADATNPKSFEMLMGGEQAELVVTDPPYNVPIDGHASGLGSVKHADFVMGSGEMSKPEFVAFLKNVLGSLAAHSRNGSIHFAFMSWHHIFELLAAGQQVYDELKNICVWVKTNGGMGGLYRSQCELVAVFKRGTAAHINNIGLGQYGRNRTNVWTCAGMNSFGAECDELAMHPTIKPVRLIEDAILDCSNRGGLVVDAFLGSGTTLIAAERTGRRAFGLEYEPRYVDLSLNRLRKLMGVEPLHVDSGLKFDELGKARQTRPTRSGHPTNKTKRANRNSS
jgi:DNA modification methylase